MARVKLEAARPQLEANSRAWVQTAAVAAHEANGVHPRARSGHPLPGAPQGARRRAIRKNRVCRGPHCFPAWPDPRPGVVYDRYQSGRRPLMLMAGSFGKS